MSADREPKKPDLALHIHHPKYEGGKQVTSERDEDDNPVYPELDADGDHVHFEMVPMHGDALMWLTVRRGITPELAASSLRKIADLIDHHGVGLLDGLQGRDEPVRLDYDENGNIMVRD